ncbi:MAG: tRNA 2-thiouridine(34) synthase MnmA [Armatimonadota bacterium]
MARVLVALSGGVDSSVAAYLLQKAGHTVTGVTILGTGPPEAPETCRHKAAAAAEVCSHLGIPHHTHDLTDEFAAEVLEDFVCGYAEGLTPNPCVLCNPRIKWGYLLQHALDGGFDAIATGHYAVIDRGGDRLRLLRGVDESRDQSYMLYRLSQYQLGHTRLPLGEYTKSRVRQIAREADIPAAETPESQDLCFVPGGDYVEFLRGRATFEPGPIIDLQGNTLGEHEGLPCYTVGQRRGLGIAAEQPLYVIKKDPGTNALIVGPRSEVQIDVCALRDLNWVSIEPPQPGEEISGQIEVRFRTTPVEASVVIGRESAVVNLSQPTVCAPGQSAVLYDGDILLGGGIIARRDEG